MFALSDDIQKLQISLLAQPVSAYRRVKISKIIVNSINFWLFLRASVHKKGIIRTTVLTLTYDTIKIESKSDLRSLFNLKFMSVSSVAFSASEDERTANIFLKGEFTDQTNWAYKMLEGYWKVDFF